MTSTATDDDNAMDTSEEDDSSEKSAIVFGASGIQGRAVVEGLMDSHSYSKVYGVTRNSKDTYLSDVLGATLIQADISLTEDIEKTLQKTKSQYIFLVTTTEIPNEIGQTSGFYDAQIQEENVIVNFFKTLIKVYKSDKIKRHVILSTLDNVEKIVFDETSQKSWITPLDDSSIVAHYSGKGSGGEKAISLLSGYPELSLTTITLPFLHGNFLGFFTPLPIDDSKTQWTISANFNDNTKIDMISESDLAYIIPRIFADFETYDGMNLRLSAEKISLEDVASIFSDLFGKDVIYNRLTYEEMSMLPIPAAGCMAQMCQFISDPRGLGYSDSDSDSNSNNKEYQHDVDITTKVMKNRKPQQFKDWLLCNSDSSAFEKVGLSLDGVEIMSVTVFGATTQQGQSVIKGLLADGRKQYTIRAAICTQRETDADKEKISNDIQSLDPDRVSVVYADYDNVDSCKKAVDGVDGAFLITDFSIRGSAAEADDGDTVKAEEEHARNVIDACEASHSVKHLVFSTMETVEEMNRKMKELQQQQQHGTTTPAESSSSSSSSSSFDAKARSAAYARSKKISVTYVLMPCYSEMFFDLLKLEKCIDKDTGKERNVMTIPLKNDTKVMCMSVEDLGPAVANIFDSYQCYAGHEIGLVTDFVTVKEATDIINEVFMEKEEEAIEDDGDGSNKKMREEEEEGQKKEDIRVEARDTYMKDFGQMFSYLAHTDAVKERHSIAKTMKLVPNARSLRLWVEQNKDNVAFREKLGLR